MQQKLSDMIMNLPIVKCKTHPEEATNLICLDKNCKDYFELVCPECLWTIHPEHSQKLYKSVKKLFREFSDLEIIQQFEIKEEQKSNQNQEQEDELKKKCASMIKELKIISNNCLRIAEALQLEINRTSNDYLNIIRENLQNNQSMMTVESQKEIFLNKIKSQVIVEDSSLNIKLRDNSISISQYESYSSLISQKIEEMKTTLNDFDFIKLENLFDFKFEISNYNNSRFDVKRINNTFYFTGIGQEQINSQEMSNNYQKTKITFKIKGNLMQTAFLIGLKKRSQICKLFDVLMFNSKESECLNIQNKGTIKVDDYIFNKKEITFICDIDIQNQHFSIQNDDKSLFYKYTGSNLSNDLCFVYYSPDLRIQEVEFLNVEIQ